MFILMVNHQKLIISGAGVSRYKTLCFIWRSTMKLRLYMDNYGVEKLKIGMFDAIST